MCVYLCEDNPANIHDYAVDVAEAEMFTSVYSKSRSNLITTHEIVSLVTMLRRRLEPPSFSLPDNVTILAGHKIKFVRLSASWPIKRGPYNITEKEKTKRFKSARFLDVTTIDGFQGRDKVIAFWNHIISHANNSSDVAFLKENRRVNVVATCARLQLIMLTRIGMPEEHFFVNQPGKKADWDTG